MKTKWWKPRRRWDRLKEIWVDPDTIPDGAIVLATMVCMGILGLCCALW